MVITDHSRNLPGPILVLPQMNELRLTPHIMVLRPRMVKAMHPDLHCSIAMDRVYLKRPRNQLARRLPADIVLDALRQRLPAQRHSALIVIELHILHKERAEPLQIACVVSIEKLSIQRRHSTRQLLLTLHRVKRLNSLSVGRNKRTQHQHHQHQSTKLPHRLSPLQKNGNTHRSTHSTRTMFAKSAARILFAATSTFRLEAVHEHPHKLAPPLSAHPPCNRSAISRRSHSPRHRC